jgi:acylpyruvate hydrolase
MRFFSFQSEHSCGIGIVDAAGEARGVSGEHDFPMSLHELIGRGPEALAGAAITLAKSPIIDLERVDFSPPVLSEGAKVVCVGLNYADHSKESNYDLPTYPTLFTRYASSIVAHRAPLIKPSVSEQFDYEGELVVVIGKAGRRISRDAALQHVAGYSVFNDGSVRDFQHRTPQWTMGKNFDKTGSYGPFLVTADELPAGAKSLKLETRLNGKVVQRASTSEMVFDVVELVAVVSEAMMLQPGDLIVAGTPSGVGAGRKPPLWMKNGDTCEVEIEGIGTLSNPIKGEQAS